MNKLLLSLLAATPLCGFAQQMENQADLPPQKDQKLIREVRMEQKTGSIFWSEDFAGGWPSGWITIDSSGICPWVYSTDGTWGYFNGNNGTSGTNAIQSTSATNGFLICDIDSANNVEFGQPSGTNYNYLASYFEIPPIDCGTHSSVILEFEQKFRYNNSVSLNVLISTDSINWTGYDVSNGLANNTVSADPDIVTLNLSSIAGNQPKVHIRIGWNARVYYWMIDDMVLREGNENDLTNRSGYWETGNELLEYYQTPISQITPITFKGSYTNNGSNNVPNVSQEIIVDFGGSTVHTGASSPMTSVIGSIDSVTQNGTFTPGSGIGTYDLTWTVTSSDSTDLNMGDNSTARDFVISDMIYARDNGIATGTIGNFSSNTGNTFKIGNLYETFGTTSTCSIEVGVSSDATNETQLIYAEIYRWNDLNGTFDFVETTDDYEILNTDLGTVVSLPLIEPVNVAAGELYLAVAGHYGGTDEVRFLLCQAVEEQTVYGFNSQGNLVYLGSPRAPIVRMSMADACAQSTEDLELDQTAVYPNPSHDQITLEFELNTPVDVNIEISDMHGRIVSSKSIGTMVSGHHQLKLDVSDLPSGIYSCKIAFGDNVQTERIVVSK
ncbi:MAG: T9SS type A sorting domain-containing protein [Flavobacteriales bacterium]|nr:T9SS type A sorting domain-containing protein [Flavobacteriales bacterium]